jgi:quercetin dioxygenase-like cupin family protein
MEEHMRRLLAVALLFTALAFAQTTTGGSATTAQSPLFVTPGKIEWKPITAGMPPGAQIAVLSGNPGADGPFILRIKVPDGYRIAPHRHPVVETTTVISGEMRIGLGDTFDESKMQTMPAGSVFSIPSETSHYAMARGETIVQTQGMGPFKRVYVNPADGAPKK